MSDVPPELWDEMDRAFRLSEALQRDGLALRYDLPQGGGHVQVSLRDLAGNHLRAVALADALGDRDTPSVVA